MYFNDILYANRKKYGCEHVLIKSAFDCISHGLLVVQMRAYGVSKDECEFMSIYLCDKYQRVKISNCRSSWT